MAPMDMNERIEQVEGRVESLEKTVGDVRRTIDSMDGRCTTHMKNAEADAQEMKVKVDATHDTAIRLETMFNEQGKMAVAIQTVGIGAAQAFGRSLRSKPGMLVAIILASWLMGQSVLPDLLKLISSQNVSGAPQDSGWVAGPEAYDPTSGV